MELSVYVCEFQLSQVSHADSGEYSCVAISELGTVVTRATLTVLGEYLVPFPAHQVAVF